MGAFFAKPVDHIEFPDGVRKLASTGDDQDGRWGECSEVLPQPRSESRVMVQTAADFDDKHADSFPDGTGQNLTPQPPSLKRKGEQERNLTPQPPSLRRKGELRVSGLSDSPLIQEPTDGVASPERRFDMQMGGRGSCRAAPLTRGRSRALPLAGVVLTARPGRPTLPPK